MKNKSYLIGAMLVVIAGGFLATTIKTITKTIGAVPPTYNQANVLESVSEFLEAPKLQPVVSYESKIEYEEAVISAVEKTSPSVVSIVISKNVPIIEECIIDQFADVPPEFRSFFGQGFEITGPCQKGSELREVGGGSGFIVSADGLIVTNKHVVSDSSASYTVFMSNGKKYQASVLATSPVQDLALIKIQASDLPVAKLGDSDSIRIGQTAIAIGNPLGELANTVSVGVVSGLARNVVASDSLGASELLEGVIQTDAAINPGNSGGPLVNLRGEVIAINTAIVSDANGLGFAIPINNVKRDIRSALQTGKIIVPFMGVRYVTINEAVAKQENLSVNYGALIRSSSNAEGVVPGSPAAKAGLQEGDIILSIDGRDLTPEESLVSRIQKYSVGDTVILGVLRQSQKLVISLTLEGRD